MSDREVGGAAEAAAAVIPGSRAMLAVIARSLSPLHGQVTVPQFRILVILADSNVALRSGDLAKALDVHPSTLVRMADRLVARGLIRRSENSASRRETLIELEPAGLDVVRTVTRRRQRDLRRILERMTSGERAAFVDAMQSFTRAAAADADADLTSFGL